MESWPWLELWLPLYEWLWLSHSRDLCSVFQVYYRFVSGCGCRMMAIGSGSGGGKRYM